LLCCSVALLFSCSLVLLLCCSVALLLCCSLALLLSCFLCLGVDSSSCAAVRLLCHSLMLSCFLLTTLGCCLFILVIWQCHVCHALFLLSQFLLALVSQLFLLHFCLTYLPLSCAFSLPLYIGSLLLPLGHLEMSCYHAISCFLACFTCWQTDSSSCTSVWLICHSLSLASFLCQGIASSFCSLGYHLPPNYNSMWLVCCYLFLLLPCCIGLLSSSRPSDCCICHSLSLDSFPCWSIASTFCFLGMPSTSLLQICDAFATLSLTSLLHQWVVFLSCFRLTSLCILLITLVHFFYSLSINIIYINIKKALLTWNDGVLKTEVSEETEDLIVNAVVFQ